MMLGALRPGLAAFPLQRADECSHGLSLAPRVLFNSLNDRAADDSSIGKFTNLCKLLGIGDTEPYSHRQFRVLADAADQIFGIRRELLLCAGHPGARDSIDKTAGSFCDLLQTIVRAGGSSEKDRI